MKSIIYKITIALYLLIFCAACNKEEDNNYVIPADKRYLSTVTNDKGETLLTVTYYDDKKIKMISGKAISYRYLYNDEGNVATVLISAPDGKIENNYIYTNGKISSYTYNGTNYPVTYNAAENSYTFNYLSDDLIKLFFDKENNCSKMITDDITIYFFYENNRKGCLFNGSNMGLTNFIGSLPTFLFFQYTLNVTTIPLESIDGPVSNKLTNEYDSANFLVKSTNKSTSFDENGDMKTTESVMNYHYIEL